ncbi:hypothetical protein GCM10010123_20620 [Pilimelia anulata]|uniref:Uncharacterized protein n=1 Tax=Pilimelia anulata TaxID=53371 RepID=A0A8J3BAJ4_9ACTN|nr:hypothetical protein [Pilimelia anulata]GGJ90631.1 hypothetical protein GCM10010123_20620 [Pilimelia anulata]
MNRRTLAVVLGAVVLAGIAGTASAMLIGDDPEPAPPSVEQVFLEETARHLCAVQSRVYPDPSALASAHRSQPSYAAVPAPSVSPLRAKLDSDPAFAARLADELRRSCRPATPTAGPGPTG